MSVPPKTTNDTRIFGIRLGVDPKILVGGLIVLALLLFWYNMRGEDDSQPATSGRVISSAAGATPAAANRGKTVVRSRGRQNDRATLRMRPVEGTRGDIDPTLRLSLLERVRGVKESAGARNLFESGPDLAAGLPNIPRIQPMVPKPTTTVVSNTTANTKLDLTVHIPLKYYGFAKPAMQGEANRGFFIDGDNILLASEGDVLEQKFLVVTLTPNTARVEDIQLKQGQELPVTPAAVAQ